MSLNKKNIGINDSTKLKRNNRIIEFFNKRNINVKLIGDMDSPAIIFEDDVCLSCYVHNFNLILTDKPFNGKNITTIKLTELNINDLKADFNLEFFNWVENAQHRAVYLIYFILNNRKVYITGFNKDKDIVYPVYSTKNPKVYFNLDSAKNIVDKFSNDLDVEFLISNNE